MNEPTIPQKENDTGRTVIIATTVILLTCIVSCAAVLIVLVLRVT